MAGKYEGIVKTKLDGFNQIDYLSGKSEKSNRDTFFYYQGTVPSAVRYKNWKFYYTMMGSEGVDALNAPTTFHWTQLQNIMRDPFENNVGASRRARSRWLAALASPSTAYIYDWNLLPIGQLLWEKELMSYIDYPPLQLAASYNLEQVLDQVREMSKNHPSQ
jgi:arylsulfatase